MRGQDNYYNPVLVLEHMDMVVFDRMADLHVHKKMYTQSTLLNIQNHKN